MKGRIPGPVLAAAAALLLGTVLFVITPVTDDGGGFTKSDGRYYGAMAGAEGFPEAFTRTAPWCHRPLTPFLVSLLPLDTLDGFRALAFASSVLSLLLMFAVARRAGLGEGPALLGIALYGGVFWAVRFSFFSPTYIDFQTQLFLLLIVYLTLADRRALLLGALALAALQKESLAAFSVFPVAFLLTRAGRTRATLAWSAALVLTPFAAALAVRLLLPAVNDYSPLVMLEHLERLTEPAFWPVLVQSLFTGLGALVPLLLLHHGPWVSYLRGAPYWYPYVVLAGILLFGGNDKSRLFLYALPLVTLLALKVVEALARVPARWRAAVWVVVLVAVHWHIAGTLRPIESVPEYLARLVPVHSKGTYVPFLVRNLVAALALAVATLALIFGRVRYRAAVGFTGDDGAEPRSTP